MHILLSQVNGTGKPVDSTLVACKLGQQAKHDVQTRTGLSSKPYNKEVRICVPPCLDMYATQLDMQLTWDVSCLPAFDCQFYSVPCLQTAER